MLTDRCRSRPGKFGEAGDRRLALHERPQDVQPGGVGEHAQRVGCPPDTIRRGHVEAFDAIVHRLTILTYSTKWLYANLRRYSRSGDDFGDDCPPPRPTRRAT